MNLTYSQKSQIPIKIKVINWMAWKIRNQRNFSQYNKLEWKMKIIRNH